MFCYRTIAVMFWGMFWNFNLPDFPFQWYFPLILVNWIKDFNKSKIVKKRILAHSGFPIHNDQVLPIQIYVARMQKADGRFQHYPTPYERFRKSVPAEPSRNHLPDQTRPFRFDRLQAEEQPLCLGNSIHEAEPL